MTIARRIILSSGALGIGLLVAGGGVFLAFSTLHRLAKSTHEEFHELCELREVATQVTLAQRHLTRGERAQAQSKLWSAMGRLEQFDRYQGVVVSEFGAQHAREERDAAGRILAAISSAHGSMASSAPLDPGAYAALEQASDDLMALMARTEQAIADIHTQSAEQFAGTLWFVVLIEMASLVAAIAVGILLYRSVVAPLRRMRNGTERLAEGKLDTRLEARGDREFVELQSGFNTMAEQLESLCRNLERRVAEKSRELAVAERLASVGFLAAGVAHEINNPLAIMSGYAESLIRTAGNAKAGPMDAEWIKDLKTIRDEAFRCKRITQSLLDLSRLGDDHREQVALAPVVENCIRLISAWPTSRHVRIEMQHSQSHGSVVLASEPELKQVILNLLANAVEATAATHGAVTVATRRNNGWVEVAVRDDGCGMTAETLANAFEPFYSSGKAGAGLGLGLAISHAIARRHGGTLEAASPGPGGGSTLVLRLPAAEEHAA